MAAKTSRNQQAGDLAGRIEYRYAVGQDIDKTGPAFYDAHLMQSREGARQGFFRGANTAGLGPGVWVAFAERLVFTP